MVNDQLASVGATSIPNEVPQEFPVKTSLASMVPSVELVTPSPAQPALNPIAPVGLLDTVRLAVVPVPELVLLVTYWEVVSDPVTDMLIAESVAPTSQDVVRLAESVMTRLLVPVVGVDPDGHPNKYPRRAATGLTVCICVSAFPA